MLACTMLTLALCGPGHPEQALGMFLELCSHFGSWSRPWLFAGIMLREAASLPQCPLIDSDRVWG